MEKQTFGDHLTKEGEVESQKPVSELKIFIGAA